MNALQKMLRRITDNYSKDPDSNVGKLLNIAATEIEKLEETADKIRLWRDIDHAEGETLDRIGYNVQQWRGQATDPVYRILIKSKIARNLSDGSINTIIEVLAITLDTDPENIAVKELWDENEPAAIQVDVPTEALNEAGFSLIQFGRLANRIVAAGVRANVLLEGTFQFSSDYESVNMDSEKGYAALVIGDAYGQTEYGLFRYGEYEYDVVDGGYFGAVYDPTEDPDLPM